MQIIVNCDDFGYTEDINQGIYDAHRAGCLSSATLMVNRGALESALDIAQECSGLGVGLHIDLDTLLGFGPGSRHYGHTLTDVDQMKYHQAILELKVIRQAIDQQFARCMQLRIPLSHFDGHHHVHLLPHVFKLAVAVAAEYGVHRLRFFESYYETQSTVYRRHRDLLDHKGFTYASDFRDFSQASALSHLCNGTTELMVHVSREGVNSEKWRTDQIQRLASTATTRTLREQAVDIVSYAALP